VQARKAVVIQLGQLEASVMERIWSRSRPVLVRDVVEDLQHDRAIAYTTVMTVMDNLHRKGLLRRARSGRAYEYTAAKSREQHTADLMEEVLASSGDRSATLLRFVEHISGEELVRLRAALEQDPADTGTGS
jgi:predicted transcriptional regulator